MIHIDMKNCTLFLIDGTGANFIAIRIGEGNFTYATKRSVEPRLSRGQLWQSREGDEQVTEIAMQYVWDSITSSGDEPPTIEEVIYGNAPGWTSATLNDALGPRTVNLQIVRSYTCRQPNGTDVTDGETYNFPEFNVQELNHSLRDATVDCKGYSNRVKPTVTRP